jgi:hypothetical protein
MHLLLFGLVHCITTQRSYVAQPTQFPHRRQPNPALPRPQPMTGGDHLSSPSLRRVPAGLEAESDPPPRARLPCLTRTPRRAPDLYKLRRTPLGSSAKL